MSILLAQFSYQSWEKSLEKQGMTPPPHSDKARKFVNLIAYILIGVGFAGNSNTPWERILWIVLAAFFIGSLYIDSQESHRK